MAGFIGMTVQVTLKEPANTVLHGQVAEVVAGQTLALRHVVVPATGAQFADFTVLGSAIADLQVIGATAPAQPPAASSQPSPDRVEPHMPQQPNQSSITHQIGALPARPAIGHAQTQASSFVDPAIMSYGRTPLQPKQAPVPVEAPATPVKSIVAKAAEALPSNSSPFVGEARDATASKSKHKVENRTVASQPIAVSVQPSGQIVAGAPAAADAAAKKKGRRSQNKASAGQPHEPPSVMNADVSRNGNDMDVTAKRGKGWRQTPFLQPSPQSTGLHSGGATPKSRKQRDKERAREQSGWATEDATDIQDLGEFDFEANHKLFDKKQVFSEIREADTTADEDRLVSHNRIHRPGTYGGKNLHPTENVLSPRMEPTLPSNDVDSTSDEVDLANDMSSSRHSLSRVSAMKQPSRQNSLPVDGRPHPLTASLSDRSAGITRSMTSLSGRGGRSVLGIATPPLRADGTQSPLSTASATRSHAARAPSLQRRKPRLVVHPTMATCPVLFPMALAKIEQETVCRVGLTPEAITETAARYVAEVAMSMFNHSTTPRRGSHANGSDKDAAPVVVVMAGNHATGARAVAAVRHLMCRNVRVIVAEGPYDAPEDLDVQMKSQTAVLKRLVKDGAAVRRGAWRKASQHIKSLAGPPALIIDALLAGEQFDALTAAESTVVRDMIDWANRSRAPVLALACPSGLSGTDGIAPVIDGEPLAVRAKATLSFGAPLRGLVLAMRGGERWEDMWLADIGVNVALRSEDAVPFGPSWLVQLRDTDDEVVGIDA